MVIKATGDYEGIRKLVREKGIRFDPKLHGGVVMDVGCYCINFARLYAGEEPSADRA